MNQTLKVKVKKLDDKAILPTYAKDGDACLDLTAVSFRKDDKDISLSGEGWGLNKEDEEEIDPRFAKLAEIYDQERSE